MIEQAEPQEPAFGWPSVCPACGAREPQDCECSGSARAFAAGRAAYDKATEGTPDRRKEEETGDPS